MKLAPDGTGLSLYTETGPIPKIIIIIDGLPSHQMTELLRPGFMACGKKMLEELASVRDEKLPDLD